MINAQDYVAIQPTWPESFAARAKASLDAVTSDLCTGALSSAKATLMVSGCVTLLAAGVLASSQTARTRVLSQLPIPIPITVAQEPRVEPASADPAASFADPQQKRIAQYLVRRYRVADGAVRQLVSTAFEIGRERNLDPLLILSVVAIESSLNPFAQSAMGAQGLMQVMTRVHARRFEPHGGEAAALDPVANMQVGSSILHEMISRGGSVERGLQLYVGAGNQPDDGGYGARVLGERARLSMAANGKVDAAIAAAIRSAAAAQDVKASVKAEVSESSSSAIPSQVPAAINSTTEAQQTPKPSEHSV